MKFVDHFLCLYVVKRRRECIPPGNKQVSPWQETVLIAGTRTVTMPSIAPAPSTVQAKSLAASAPVGAQSLITSQATQQPQQQQQQQQQPTQMKISMPVGQNQQVGVGKQIYAALLQLSCSLSTVLSSQMGTSHW